MTTHRGLNLSSIAQEGLEGLPGVLIAVFFVCCGTLLLLDLFTPAFTKANSNLLVAIYFLASAVAGITYVLSQRRDRRLTAQLEEQFHELSGPARQAGLSTAPAGVDESVVVEQLPSVTPPDALAPEGLLAVVVWFFFLWGMIAMFVSPEHQNVLLGVFAAISGGVVIASILLRVRNHWRARQIARGRY
jgi:Flp pilus assembly protein TadB